MQSRPEEKGRVSLLDYMEKVLSAPILELSSQNECLAHSQGSTGSSYTRVTAHQNSDAATR